MGVEGAREGRKGGERGWREEEIGEVWDRVSPRLQAADICEDLVERCIEAVRNCELKKFGNCELEEIDEREKEKERNCWRKGWRYIFQVPSIRVYHCKQKLLT